MNLENIKTKCIECAKDLDSIIVEALQMIIMSNVNINY